MSDSKRQWWIKETCHGCDNAYTSPLDQSGSHDELILVQEVDQVCLPINMAQEAYEAYSSATGGKSLVTGDTLPDFVDLSQEIKSAWMISAAWVVGRTLRAEKRGKTL